MTGVRLGLAALVVTLGACTESIVAPGACPAFCPSDSIQVRDTVLSDVITGDSAFAGYVRTDEGVQLAVADLPGVVDSRALYLLNSMFTRVVRSTNDTTTVPIVVDSSIVQVSILLRDTNTTNLWLKLYRLPLALDTATTFAAVAPAFATAAVDSVNLDSLLAQPLTGDSTTRGTFGGDSVRRDAGHVVRVSDVDSSLFLFFVLDTLQAPFVAADSGKLAFGVRVAADSLASVALGADHADSDRDAFIRRYYHYTGRTAQGADTTIYATTDRQSTFDTFVFQPPHPPLDAAAVDTSLVVGGAPSVRSLLRVTIPDVLRDSTDVVRATLTLVPIAAVPGARGDSFTVVARPVVSDLGAKSPLATNRALWGIATVRVNSTDTVQIEITDLLRSWVQDTAAATALMLSQFPEAGAYTQIRFYASRVPAFRPALRVTYVRRFPFGRP